jgi:hypothetical protein
MVAASDKRARCAVAADIGKAWGVVQKEGMVVVSILIRFFGVSAEKAVGLPLRTPAAVGNVRHQSANHFLIFCSRCQIYRLFKIVGRGVIPMGQPISE